MFKSKTVQVFDPEVFKQGWFISFTRRFLAESNTLAKYTVFNGIIYSVTDERVTYISSMQSMGSIDIDEVKMGDVRILGVAKDVVGEGIVLDRRGENE